MRVRGIVIAFPALAAAWVAAPFTACAVLGQTSFPSLPSPSTPPSLNVPSGIVAPLPLPADSLRMTASHCTLWATGGTHVVELQGPLNIELDHTRLSADRAVVWLRPIDNQSPGEQRVQIALIGHAQLRNRQASRFDHDLLVRAQVSGTIQLIGEREARRDEASDLYRTAEALRAGGGGWSGPATRPPASTQVSTTGPTTRGATSQAVGFIPSSFSGSPTTEAATQPFDENEPVATTQAAGQAATQPAVPRPTRFVEFDDQAEHTEFDEHGNIVAVLSGGVTLRYGDPKGNLLEFEADRAVMFTDLKTLKGANQGGGFKNFIADHVKSVYFEGDVRVFSTPADTAKPELRMRAERVFYELASDRAVMTDVVFHTINAQKQLPMIMRAKVMRQLSQDEWSAQGVQLSTSSFATPDYSLGAGSAYIHAEPTDEPAQNGRGGEAVTFNAQDATFQALGVPLFYFPQVSGTLSTNPFPLREIGVGSSSNFGFTTRTEWGLFESLGKMPPKDTDASYRLDYYGSRGPAGGVDAKYVGGVVDQTTKQPFDFSGDLHAYFVEDRGYDVLGGIRPNEQPPHEFTGRAYLEHQDFFPDDWQAQVRLGWVSDDNFLLQWFPDEYYQGTRIDESLYLKHSSDDEVFSLLAQWQPNDVVTTSDDVPAQREVDHLPQLAYEREGTSLLDDQVSLFSENTATGLKFIRSGQTLAAQGFVPGFGPGIPAFAYTGDPGDFTYRGDFREELDYPINAGPMKVVPYVFGRYTAYSQGVQPGVPTARINLTQKSVVPDILASSDQNRFFAGAGMRLSTQFWHVDDQAESDLFDIHRIRHVIEPELDLFTSSQSIDQDHLFIYDPDVDGINDVQALNLAIRQRWQTKRGGPGRWRSVDFFTWNIDGDFYANKPAERFRDPADFRGLYFNSEPEFSQPRDSINSDALWRLSDTTAVLADMSHNLDYQKLATASLGFAATRTDLVSYYLGVRYIDELHSTFGSAEINYNLTRKYNLDVSASIDLQQTRGVFYSAQLTRKFDRFSASVNAYYDQYSNNNGFSFNFQPYGFGRGLGTSSLTQPE